MSSCPGIGASSTSENVRRLDGTPAAPPRSSPDANSLLTDAQIKRMTEAYYASLLAGDEEERQEGAVGGWCRRRGDSRANIPTHTLDGPKEIHVFGSAREQALRILDPFLLAKHVVGAAPSRGLESSAPP